MFLIVFNNNSSIFLILPYSSYFFLILPYSSYFFLILPYSSYFFPFLLPPLASSVFLLSSIILSELFFTLSFPFLLICIRPHIPSMFFLCLSLCASVTHFLAKWTFPFIVSHGLYIHYREQSTYHKAHN
jgi:hypothetical protein